MRSRSRRILSDNFGCLGAKGRCQSFLTNRDSKRMRARETPAGAGVATRAVVVDDDGASMGRKLAVVTGANSGIGKETVKSLVAAGYDVVMACRNADAAMETKRTIAGEVTGTESQMSVLPCNLSSLSSIRAFAEAFREKHGKLDLLVNNAGVMMIPDLRNTEDGFEEHWGVNYLSHFHLTSLLFPSLLESPSSRIVNVSSAANSFGNLDSMNAMFSKDSSSYDAWQAYGNSKLGNLMFTFELDRKLRGAGIENIAVNAVHPGLVKTNLGRYMNPLVTQFFKLLPEFFVLSPETGARTQVDVALSDSFEGVSGKYFADQTFKLQPGTYAEENVVVNKLAKDQGELSKLWEYSNQVTESKWDAIEEVSRLVDSKV